MLIFTLNLPSDPTIRKQAQTLIPPSASNIPAPNLLRVREADNEAPELPHSNPPEAVMSDLGSSDDHLVTTEPEHTSTGGDRHQLIDDLEPDLQHNDGDIAFSGRSKIREKSESEVSHVI